MSQAVPALRAALARFLQGEAEAALARARARDPDDDQPPDARREGRWLVSERADEVFEEAGERGALREVELARLREQRRAVRYLVRALPAEARLRERLRQARLASDIELSLPDSLPRLAAASDAHGRAELAREIDHALRPIACAHAEELAHAEEPLCIELAPPEAQQPTARPSGLLIVSAFDPGAMQTGKRGLPPPDEAAVLDEFVRGTQAAAEDAVARILRGLHAASPLPWHTLLRALRAPELDSESASKQRGQRVAAWLRGIGFSRELQGLRGEPDRGAAGPEATVLALSPPQDVRVAQSRVEHGVASDVCAARGVAHALGLALVHPALPIELRAPCVTLAHPAGALGALSAQLWAERGQLQRVQGMSEAAAERVGRVAAALVLLSARAQCALATLEIPAEMDPQARVEATAEALGRALCCDVPLGPALFGLAAVPARAQALEHVAGFALHHALRERCDEDFYRNPRTAEPLRMLCTRGQEPSLAALCEELGAPLARGKARAEELVA